MSPSIAGATTTGADDARHGGGHDVPGEAVGHRPQPVRGRRRDDDRIGGVGDHDVADPAVREQVEDVGLDGVAAQGRERQRPDERVAAGVSITDHVGALGAEQAEQLDRLVRGDRAGDPEPDQPAGEAAPTALTAAPAPAARRRRPRRGGSRGP